MIKKNVYILLFLLLAINNVSCKAGISNDESWSTFLWIIGILAGIFIIGVICHIPEYIRDYKSQKKSRFNYENAEIIKSQISYKVDLSLRIINRSNTEQSLLKIEPQNAVSIYGGLTFYAFFYINENKKVYNLSFYFQYTIEESKSYNPLIININDEKEYYFHINEESKYQRRVWGSPSYCFHKQSYIVTKKGDFNEKLLNDIYNAYKIEVSCNERNLIYNLEIIKKTIKLYYELGGTIE